MTGPLKDIVVLDLTHVLAGPFASMIMADMGATVIKIEQPGIGDRSRASGPFLNGESTYFMSLNRGKKGMTLDLKKANGKNIFLKLLEKADIVLENMSPGAMNRLGLGYDILKDYNPRIIYASISGFGQTGPYAHKGALDVIIQGMGGVMSITGEPDGPPIRPGVSQGDITPALFSVIGVLSALQERSNSGKGQFVDISMLDCQISILENAFIRYLATGVIPKPLGTKHPVTAPFQAFPTKDGYITVALADGRNEKWPLFCSAIDKIDLINDQRLDDGWLRSQNWHLAEPIINEALSKKTSSEWLFAFEELGIPCGPIYSINEVVEDEQVKHRQMIHKIPHPRLGHVDAIDTPVKLSRTPGGIQSYSPELGEHTEDLLRNMLHLTDQEIRQLREDKSI